MRTDEDVQLINGFINSPFYNPEFSARVAGAYGIDIKPPNKELYLKRADATWHNETLDLSDWAAPVPTFFRKNPIQSVLTGKCMGGFSGRVNSDQVVSADTTELRKQCEPKPA